MKRVHSLDAFAVRLREQMPGLCSAQDEKHDWDPTFDGLAVELFRLQFEHNSVYRNVCLRRGVLPQEVSNWAEIPTISTVAFKESELSCIPGPERTNVFLSSGTTGHQPSRHFHHDQSLQLYESSLLAWFRCSLGDRIKLISQGLALTPDSTAAPNSSLIHMFETLRRSQGFRNFSFSAQIGPDGGWVLDCGSTIKSLENAIQIQAPIMLFGTAFSFVHLLDFLSDEKILLKLPPGSMALETGGYKGRSRLLPKPELHSLLSKKLGVPLSSIISEYGMSELSSQAYDVVSAGAATRSFRFPPWVRAQIISPETGRSVAEGETGLLRIFDLANVYSVMGIQTEDLAIRRGQGFELIGRVESAEQRGCSLMAAS